jgi:hypothetical protein
MQALVLHEKLHKNVERVENRSILVTGWPRETRQAMAHKV